MDLRTYAKAHLPHLLVQALKVAKYEYDVRTFPRRRVSHRYGPYDMTLHIHDRVAEEWYDRDWEVPSEMAILRARGLKPGALVFDLGAHQCLIAMMLAKQTTPGGRIVAVEANKHNARVAGLNLAINAVTNVDVLHAMVSDRTGKDLAATSLNSSKAARRVRIGSDLVDTFCIDDLSRRYGRPDVVYMDIEGFEIKALEGAGATLAQRPTWFIELHGDEMLAAYGTRNAEVLRFFPSEDYEGHVCRQAETSFRPLLNASDLPAERCFTVFAPVARPG